MFHKVLKRIIQTQRKHKFVFLNNHPDIQTNCIYAVNHSCKWDLQYVMELVPGCCTLLVGKQRLNLIDQLVIILNGVVWVDRKDKSSKAASKEKMYAALKKRKSVCMFPEGTWNLRPSLLALPLYWGIVDVAKKSRVPIVPVCFEYVGRDCYVKYGEAFAVGEEEDKAEVIKHLRDVFATLKWDIWEHFPIVHRDTISDDEWNKEVQRRLLEYTKLDYEYEMSCIRTEK